MVTTNVDMILETLRQKKSVSINDMSKQFGILQQDIQKSAEYLEEEGIVKIEYKFPNTFVTLVKGLKANGIPPPLVEQQPQASPMPRAELQIPKLKPMEPAQKTPETDSNPFSQIPAYENKTKDGSSAQAMYTDTETNKQMGTDRSMKQVFYQNTGATTENNTGFQNQSFQSTQQNNTLPLLFSEHKEKDPFDIDKPKFYMKPPDPVNREKMALPNYDDNYDTQENLSEGIIGIDRIESMLDILEKRIRNQDFKDLNVIYRRVYDLFNTSDYMSPNEKRIIAERINTIFSRAKRIYSQGNIVI